LLPAFVTVQLSRPVEPTTTRATKKSKRICNVLDCEGVASKTSDIGPPIASTFVACKSRTGISIHILYELSEL
jgi:rhamnogalacturonan hydrolase